MKRFDHSDGSYIQIEDTGRLSRSGSQVISESGKKYNPRFDYLGDKKDGIEHPRDEIVVFN